MEKIAWRILEIQVRDWSVLTDGGGKPLGDVYRNGGIMPWHDVSSRSSSGGPSELPPWWFALFVYSWMDTSAPADQCRGNGPLCYLLICQAHVTHPVNGLLCDDSEWPFKIEVIFHLPTPSPRRNEGPPRLVLQPCPRKPPHSRGLLGPR